MIFLTWLSVGITLILLFHLSNGNNILSRDQWNARPPKSVEYLTQIPNYVIIHHSYIPGACSNLTDCIAAVKIIQNMHMDDNKWSDIGYNFIVGGDGLIFEGRGWDRVGAHTKGYNSVGLGFVVIGDYRSVVPKQSALDAVIFLIEFGMAIGKINTNFKLRGHRDLVPTTECPGQAFYDLIRTWPRY